jgi:hypothetical protein
VKRLKRLLLADSVLSATYYAVALLLTRLVLQPRLAAVPLVVLTSTITMAVAIGIPALADTE